MMVGDVDNKAILRLGHRPSEDYVKPLPCIEAARALLDLKSRIHDDEVTQACEEIETYNSTVQNGIQERLHCNNEHELGKPQFMSFKALLYAVLHSIPWGFEGSNDEQ